jgi:hypothetical protein
MAALQQLPCLTSLDISRCLAQQQQQQGDQRAAPLASQQPVALLALLTGATKQQQQQQQQRWQLLPGTSCSSADALAGLAAAVPTSISTPSTFFSSLRCLQCRAVNFVFEPAVWVTLSNLTHLDVAGCDKFRGEGMSRLTGLQELVASGKCAEAALQLLNCWVATKPSDIP